MILPKHKVTANDITSIDLARDKTIGHSPTISIPIEGNTKYKVTVSEGKGGKYLRIDITKRTPHTVTYEFSGDHPGNQYLPASEQATATTKVTLPTVTTPITGTLNGQDGIWTFKSWTLPDGVTFTDDTHTKFTMPDEDVTVTGKWTFTSDPTPVYVYFRTVDSAGNDIDNVEGVTYNNDDTDSPHHWATLGKLETKTSVTDSVYEALGKEVAAQTGFEYYTGNNSFPLNLITWEKVSTHNGAQDYVSPDTEAWHLDGKVTAYRAIYCDSDGKELKGFDPNKTPKYYLEGTDDVALTSKVPDVPGKVFDGWDTNDVTVKNNNTFIMPDKDVTFTAKWKTGTLEIEKILEGNPPAAGNIFSFTVTPEGSTTGTDARITGAGNATIPILPVCNYTVEEDSNTAAVNGYRCTTQYSTDRTHWQDIPITVSVASNDTVTVYVKNSYTPITADLIDDDITIKHGVNADPEHGNDDDTNAHIVKKNATISYQATLDMKNLKFGANPEHADDVSSIQTMIGTGPLWKFMQGENITMFAGSTVNLYVKFSDKLVNPAALNGITLESGWFKLDQNNNNKPTYNSSTGYWTIPCVIKGAGDEGVDTKNPSITLSGITLPLTAAAQDELSNGTELTITSESYIDGTIKISTHELSLIGKSKDAPAKNTAKLKLAVPTYTVTYDGNGADSGKTTDNTAYATGTTATVKANGYTRNGYTFTGWNTKADGSGTPYKTGDWITMTGSVILYAQWTRNSSHGGDDDDKYFFAIQKVDAQDGHALNGAKFELYQLDKNDRIVNRRVVRTTQQSNKNGIALFLSLIHI